MEGKKKRWGNTGNLLVVFGSMDRKLQKKKNLRIATLRIKRPEVSEVLGGGKGTCSQGV